LPGRPSLRRVAALLAAGVAALILVTAVGEATPECSAVARTRADLVGQVRQRTTQ